MFIPIDVHEDFSVDCDPYELAIGWNENGYGFMQREDPADSALTTAGLPLVGDIRSRHSKRFTRARDSRLRFSEAVPESASTGWLLAPALMALVILKMMFKRVPDDS